MKKFLIAMASIFGILAIIFYFTSLNHLDSYTARALGTSTTINIQGMIFCAGSAVICAINVVGIVLMNFMESNGNSKNACTGYTSGGIRTEDGGVKMTSTNYWTCPKCKSRNPFSKIECRECGNIRQ